MPRTKKHSGNPKPHAPSAASKATHSIKPRLDMRRRDPFAITAQVDTTYPRRREDAEYVSLSSADQYAALVPAWQEEQA